MPDQTITVTMHTLNKYGVPCTDVTDYKNAEDGGSGDTFYIQKSHYEYLVSTKIFGAALTGIAGYMYCVFRNNQDEFMVSGEAGIGYCDYYSLHNGQLMKTVELPFMIGGGGSYNPMVDIGSDHVVYSAVEFDGDVTKYNRFRRESNGELTHTGWVHLEKNYYIPSDVLYLGGIDALDGSATVRPKEFPASSVDPTTDTFTVPDHGLLEEEWVHFTSTVNVPSPLIQDTAYVVVNVTQHTFQLSRTPPNFGPVIDLTNSGSGTITMFIDYGYYAYDGVTLSSDLSVIRPSRIRINQLYITAYSQGYSTGRFYYEALPDLSANSAYKRIALGYIDLLVGDLAPGTDYVAQVPFSELLPEDTPGRASYTMLVNVFNKDVDDGSGKYHVGSGNINAYWYNNNTTRLIVLSFDDIRGGSGNQNYMKWYDEFGNFLYDWIYPSYLFEGTEEFYVLYPRIDEGLNFFHLAIHPRTGEARLLRYHLLTGQLLSGSILENPTLEQDGLAYRLSNRQLIDGRYLMLHTNSEYHVFFDAWSPDLGIRGQVTITGASETYGFYVVPNIDLD